MDLLSIGDSNPKIGKSDKANAGYRSAILHLSPATESGKNLCPKSSAGCRKACLYNQGRGKFELTRTARLRRTHLWLNQPTDFKEKLYTEIDKFIIKCDKENEKPAIRLNGTSDIVWEKKWPALFNKYSNIQFYDYTKVWRRFDTELPDNYYLVFSRSENNDADCLKVLRRKGTVAVVFRDELPKKWNRFRVIDGDSDDLVFLKPKGVVLGLMAKGTAKHDTSGFVVDP